MKKNIQSGLLKFENPQCMAYEWHRNAIFCENDCNLLSFSKFMAFSKFILFECWAFMEFYKAFAKNHVNVPHFTKA